MAKVLETHAECELRGFIAAICELASWIDTDAFIVVDAYGLSEDMGHAVYESFPGVNVRSWEPTTGEKMLEAFSELAQFRFWDVIAPGSEPWVRGLEERLRDGLIKRLQATVLTGSHAVHLATGPMRGAPDLLYAVSNPATGRLYIVGGGLE